jgi:hypothetical protein
VTGFNSIIAGVRGSSVKSVLYSFQELNASTNPYGKFDSKNPCASTICFNGNSVRYPALPLESLSFPARVQTELQRSVGSFNSSDLKYASLPSQFCKLSAGGNAQSITANAATQDYQYSLVTAATGAAPPTSQSAFYFGVDLEDVNNQGFYSGLNLNSSQAFLELNVANAPTYAHTVFCISALDSIVIVDARSGSCDVRI